MPAQNGPKEKTGFPRLHEWHSFFNQHYRKGDWEVCTPEIVQELSGIGYVFARRSHMASQNPIGVIDVSRGGTCMETWLPMDVLETTRTAISRPIHLVRRDMRGHRDTPRAKLVRFVRHRVAAAKRNDPRHLRRGS